MRGRPWWSWQWYDVLLGLFCLAFLLGFLYAVVHLSALLIVAVMHHIRHSLHHP
jgi:hypothetical protein